MSVSNIESLLAELGFSVDLPESVRRKLSDVAELRTYPRGARIFAEGEVDPHAYIVVRGTIGLQMHVPERGQLSLMTLGSGDLLGWSAVLGQGPMSAGAVALEDSELIVVSASALSALCEANHDVGYHVMRRFAQALARRLLATRLQLLDLYAHEQPSPPAIAKGTS